jgi:hypothetical protein
MKEILTPMLKRLIISIVIFAIFIGLNNIASGIETPEIVRYIKSFVGIFFSPSVIIVIAITSQTDIDQAFPFIHGFIAVALTFLNAYFIVLILQKLIYEFYTKLSR